MSEELVIVIESLGNGGAQHVATTLANGYSRQGRKITVITLQSEENDSFFLDDEIDRVVLSGSSNSKNLFQAIIANFKRIYLLRKALKTSKARTIISFVSEMNIITILSALGLSKRVIISERNDPTRQSLGTAWNLLRRFLYRHADLVTANSRVALDGMKPYVPGKKLFWLPNPLRRPTDKKVIKLTAPTILSVGRLNQQKAFDVLIKGFAKFSLNHPDWQLIILGEGPERNALEQLAQELQISTKLSMPGFVEPFPYYRAAEIYAHTAQYEGLPNAAIEAMSQALPVIVSDTVFGLFEYLSHEESGLIVAMDNPNNLTHALSQLADDPEKRLRFGKIGQQSVQSCAPERVIEIWDETLTLT